jgi:hypothetical protein
VTRCCGCQCHRYHGPKWACSLCGRGFTRKFSVLRHLDTLHEGCGTPILYDKYRFGQPLDGTANTQSNAAGPNSHSGVSPKTRQILALINGRAKEAVASVLAACVENFDKNMIISAKICKSCLTLIFDGYFYSNSNNKNEISLPSHLCSCEWLFDYPSIEKKRGLVETYLNEKIATRLSEVLISFGSESDQINISFVKMNDLNLTRLLNISVDISRNRQGINEVHKHLFNEISEHLKNQELEILDDIARNYTPLDGRQFWWSSYINGDEGNIIVSRQDGLKFLQFFKSNYGRIILKGEGCEYYYRLIIS